MVSLWWLKFFVIICANIRWNIIDFFWYSWFKRKKVLYFPNGLTYSEKVTNGGQRMSNTFYREMKMLCPLKHPITICTLFGLYLVEDKVNFRLLQNMVYYVSSRETFWLDNCHLNFRCDFFGFLALGGSQLYGFEFVS